MKTYLKGVFVSLFIIFLIGVSIYTLERRNFFALSELEIHFSVPEGFSENIAFTNWQTELKKDMRALYGISLLKLKLQDLNQVLQLHKWVKEIEIHRQFPNQLQVKVEPYRWKALYLKNNKLFPFTEDNSFLPAIQLTQAPSLPIVQIENLESKSEVRKNLSDILNLLPVRGVLSLESVNEITNSSSGILLSVNQGPTYVRLGEEQLRIRMARVEKVIEYLKEHNLQGRVISADFSQKVVVKLRKAR